MDEKVLEEIRFHPDAVTKDANSPLYQIREKEMEISGRVFAARSQADKMVSDARQRATEIVRSAHTDAERLAKERGDKVLKQSEKETAKIAAEGAAAVEVHKSELATRTSDAAGLVVKLVTSV